MRLTPYWLDFANFALEAQSAFSDLIPPPELEDFHQGWMDFLMAARRFARTQNLDAPYRNSRLLAEYEVRVATAAIEAAIEEISVATRETLRRAGCR